VPPNVRTPRAADIEGERRQEREAFGFGERATLSQIFKRDPA